MALWTAPFADGWNAEQNADGVIGCGGGGTRTDPPSVRMVGPDEHVRETWRGGRAVGWLNRATLLFLRDDRPGELWQTTIPGGEMARVAEHAEGNTLRAADGHWASALVAPEAIGRVLYDGRLLYSGAMWDGVAVAGERLLHTKPDTDGWPMLQEYVGGQAARAHRLPANGNAWTLHADGWIGMGYFGESWLLVPDSNEVELVTVTPWRQEGPPTVALAQDGTPWLWTPTASPSGRLLVVGRPYEPGGALHGGTSVPCVQVDLPATWLRVRVLDGQWSIVAVDGGGRLRVATVPLDAPREVIAWEPPAPLPVPPPPPPPFPLPLPARPTITIPYYGPTEGQAPLTWQAQATTTGVVTRIVWRWRKRGTTTWITKDDDQHTTVTFTERGLYEIGVDVYGPGGRDGTAVQRLITVT